MITLKRAAEKDIPAIQDLANKTWYTTYAEYISKAQIGYMLNKMYNKEELALQAEEGYIFLIARENEQDLGFAGFSALDSDSHIYKLHKLYVLPETHGRGIGKLLIKEVIRLAREAGGKSLKLNVNRNNKATGFYIKEGFEIKETVDIDIGNGFYMNDYIMEKII